MNMINRLAQRGVLLTGLAALPLIAQTPYEADRDMGGRGEYGAPVSEHMDVERDYDFGWLGLLGLAGLAGLMRRRDRPNTTAGAHRPPTSDQL